MSGTGNGDDYEQFRRTFFEECAEILAELEGLLAEIRPMQADREPLNAIFRAVHSIKAGAGAFGYTRLVAFTHDFEAVLDSLRAGRIVHTDAISSVLVRAGDILATLVDAAQTGAAVAEGFEDAVHGELDLLLAGERSEAMPENKVEGRSAAISTAEVCYQIRFVPHPEMFRHANEPLLLLRELRQLGEIEIECDTSRLPPFESIDPEGAHLGWTIQLWTKAATERIREVFEFVDDVCDLDILPLETSTAEAGPQAAPSGHAGPAAEAQGSTDNPETNARKLTNASPLQAPVTDAIAAPDRATAASELAKGPPSASIRVDLSRIDRLVNMVGELVITQSMLAQQISDLSLGGGAQAVRGQEDLALLTRELQECVMAIRMQPVKSVFSRMPRLVRDIANRLGKSVQLSMSGEQTEVDKTVIEELADPLTHMIRNAIDHGIERPEARIEAGKPAGGTIELSALHAGSNILIHVSDDGGGIDKDKLVAKAISKGIIQAGTTLSEEETYDLLFAPGFSTAEVVSDVSGRGVGMDVVRRNIVNLGGRIQVQSVLGKGTRFTLIIPLTLAVLDGMVVAIGGERYILPLTSIIESYRPDLRHIRTITGGIQVASIRGEYIRLVYLHDLFGVPNAITDPAEGLVVLVETAQGAKIGIVVDELIGQQQVVIKSLLDNFDPVQGVSGATILGNGRVALILDIEQISRMSRPQSGVPFGSPLSLPALGAAA
ncbi:CheA Chemotaxis protein histidine kinase and related kinases [Rhabdaerophilaceae bacterium]